MSKVKHTDMVLEVHGWVGWQDLVKSNKDILSFVKKLEERTGLKFMARKERDVLNGFVTKVPEGFIVSIYGVNKSPDEESPHYFKAVTVTKDLEKKIYGHI